MLLRRLLACSMVCLMFWVSAYTALCQGTAHIDPYSRSYDLPFRIFTDRQIQLFTDNNLPATGFWGYCHTDKHLHCKEYHIVNNWKTQDSTSAVIIYKDYESDQVWLRHSIVAHKVSAQQAYDLSGNGADEIIVLYHAKDTIWLDILNVQIKSSDLYAVTGTLDLNGDGQWEGNVNIIAIDDIDSDGELDILIGVNSGSGQHTSELICFAVADSKIKWRFPFAGTISNQQIGLIPASEHNETVIILGLSSKNNWDCPIAIDNKHSSLIALDKKGMLLWTKHVDPCFSVQTSLVVKTRDSLSPLIIVGVGLRDLGSDNHCVSSLFTLSLSGEMIDSVAVSADGSKYIDHLALCDINSDRDQQIIVGLSDGTINVFDLNLIPIYQSESEIPLHLHGCCDILGIGEQQILLTTSDNHLVLVDATLKPLASVCMQTGLNNSINTEHNTKGDENNIIVSSGGGSKFLLFEVSSTPWTMVFHRKPWMASLIILIPSFVVIIYISIAWRREKIKDLIISQQREKLVQAFACIEGIKDKSKAAQQIQDTHKLLVMEKENFKNILENSIHGIIVCQGDNIVFVNSTIVKMSKINPDDFKKYSASVALEQFTFKDDQHLVRSAWGQAKNGDPDIDRIDIRHIDSEGKITWLELYYQASVFDNLPAVIVSMVDITKRKNTEKELIRSESQASAMLHATSDAACLFDLDYNYIRVNKTLQNIVGETEEKLIGSSIFNGLPDDIIENRKAICSKIINTGKAVNFSDRSHGRKFNHTVYPIINNNNDTIAIAGFSQDVTDSDYQLEQLQMYQAAVDQSINGIAIVKMDGTIQYLNKSWADMHGYTSNELINQDLEIFHTQSQIDNEVIPFNDLVIKNGSNIGIVNHKHRNGDEFPAMMSCAVIFNYSNTPIGLVGTAIDYSKEQKLLDEIENKSRRLEWLTSRLIFLQEQDRKTVARELHDSVAQKLAASKMKVEQLQFRCNGEYHEYLEEISNSISSSMQEIRLISSHLRPKMIDTLGLFASIETLISDLKTTNVIDSSYSGSDESIKPEIAINIYRIIQELFNNTIKHAQSQNILVKIEVNSDLIHLRYEDDGIGFNLDKITSGWNNTRCFGLLHITERAQVIGGKVKINTAPNEGARFLIEFRLT